MSRTCPVPASAHPPPITTITPSILYVGTPVALITTLDSSGRPNISPMSSVWSLGDRLVLGLGNAGLGCENLRASGEAVVNFPGPALHDAVERIAPTTGRNPVPDYKLAMGYRHEPDKFALGRFTPIASHCVRPPRILECPIQVEVRLLATHAAAAVGGESPGFSVLEVQVMKVHVHDDIVVPGTHHIATSEWSPLLYVFRHYFGTGNRLGRNFRAESQ